MKRFDPGKFGLWQKLRLRPKLYAFLGGTIFGLVASVTYVITGGDTWLFVPSWAWIAFYPGFVAGILSYFHLDESIATPIGCLTVGLEYGCIFLLVFTLYTFFSRLCTRKPKTRS